MVIIIITSIFSVFDIREQQIAYCFMVIVMCQTGIGEIFSVDGWSILSSCALVAGSGCVRACSGETADTWQWWVKICTQTWLPAIWWIKACSDKTWYSSVTCYTSSDFSSKCFAAVEVPLSWMKMLTVSLVCSCVCGYNVRERGKDWVYIRADVLCMLVCMWVRVFFFCRKSWTLLHRWTVVKFHFCIELNFPSWSAIVENKKKINK